MWVASTVNSPWAALGARVGDVLFQHFNAHLSLNCSLLPVQMYLHDVTSDRSVA